MTTLPVVEVHRRVQYTPDPDVEAKPFEAHIGVGRAWHRAYGRTPSEALLLAAAHYHSHAEGSS